MANLTVQVIGQKTYSRNEVSDLKIYGALQRWPKDSREIQVKCAGKDGSPLRSRSHISLADSEAPLDDSQESPRRSCNHCPNAIKHSPGLIVVMQLREDTKTPRHQVNRDYSGLNTWRRTRRAWMCPGFARQRRSYPQARRLYSHGDASHEG